MDVLRSLTAAVQDLLTKDDDARILNGILDEAVKVDKALGTSSDEEDIVDLKKLFDVQLEDGSSDSLLAVICQVQGQLRWKQARQGPQVRRACLMAPQQLRPCLATLPTAAKVEVDLLLVPAGVSIPQHAEEATVTLAVVACGHDARMGFVEELLRQVDTGHVAHFQTTVPKVIQAGQSEPLLLLYVRSDNLSGDFWFSPISDPALKKYEDVMHIDDIHDYYIKFASDYEQVMLGWGYCMPEITAEEIVKNCDLSVGNCKVLDLGCGDGLVGKALKRRGLVHLTGLDFSSTMLEKARARNCYADLQLADLLKPLPFPDNSFDLLVSVAVTTYLDPSVLRDWIRVTKSGGKIVFTHKTSIWHTWEKEHNLLEADKRLWKLLWVSDPPVPYLPSLKLDGGQACPELAKIYMYEKM